MRTHTLHSPTALRLSVMNHLSSLVRYNDGLSDNSTYSVSSNPFNLDKKILANAIECLNNLQSIFKNYQPVNVSGAEILTKRYKYLLKGHLKNINTAPEYKSTISSYINKIGTLVL